MENKTIIYIILLMCVGVVHAASYSPTSELNCITKNRTSTTCFTDYCLDYVLHENGSIECVDLRDTYCRNTTVYIPVCTRTLYSGTRYARDSGGRWVNASDVLRITRRGHDITFHYNGSRGYINITFEAGAIYNGKYYNFTYIRQTIPTLKINYPVHTTPWHKKYAVNLTGIPIQYQPNFQAIVLKYKSKYGFHISDLNTNNKRFLIKNLFGLYFQDLLDSGYNYTINPAERTITIGNLTPHITSNNLLLDPTLTLQTADTENLGDAYAHPGYPDNNYGSAELIRIGTPDVPPQQMYIGFVQFNLTGIPSNAVIEDAELILYNSSGSQQGTPNYNISTTSFFNESNITYNSNLPPIITILGNKSLTEEPFTFNLTDAIPSSRDNISIRIDQYSEDIGNFAEFFSKEYTTDTSKRPILNITYSTYTEISDCSVLSTANHEYRLTADILDSSSSNCMDITAANVTLDCQGHTIDGINTNRGIFVGAENATIYNCTVTQWFYGLYVAGYKNTNISNSNIHDNGDIGIYMYLGSDNIEIKDTKIDKNAKHGLYVTGSTNGVFDSLLIRNNTEFDVFFLSNSLADCSHTFTSVNGTDNKPILFYNDTVSLTSYDNNVSEIILCNADGSNITDLTLANSDKSNNGVLLPETDNTRILDSRINTSSTAIYYYVSSGNILTNFTTYGFSKGVYMSASTTTINYSIFHSQTGTCITHISGFDSLIYNIRYNNLFNCSTAVACVSGCTNTYNYNTSLQSGTRIYGSGNLIGGNYYTNSNADGYSETCTDDDHDGICDDSLQHFTGATDYLPLSNKYTLFPYNSTPPTISNTNPCSTQTSTIKANVTDDDGTISSARIETTIHGATVNFTMTCGSGSTVSCLYNYLGYTSTITVKKIWMQDNLGAWNSTPINIDIAFRDCGGGGGGGGGEQIIFKPGAGCGRLTVASILPQKIRRESTVDLGFRLEHSGCLIKEVSGTFTVSNQSISFNASNINQSTEFILLPGYQAIKPIPVNIRFDYRDSDGNRLRDGFSATIYLDRTFMEEWGGMVWLGILLVFILFVADRL